MNSEQMQLLDLVVELDDICRRNGVSFVIGFGCALGVERNRGFLPWDDDMDLIITRDNLLKLERVLAHEMPPDRDLVTPERYPDYHHALARYVNTASSRLARFRLMDGSPLGQLLEFFVLDPVPDDEQARREYEKYLWLYTELECPVVVIGRERTPKHMIDEDLYREYRARMDVEGRDAVLDEILEKHLTFSPEECEWMLVRWGSRPLPIKTEWMRNIEYRLFEGRMLPFMKNNIDHLTLRYGFGWNIMPKQGAELTHGVIVSDRIPQNRYIEDIRAYARSKDFERVLCENKDDGLEILFAQLDRQRNLALVRYALLQGELSSLDRQLPRPYDPQFSRCYDDAFETAFSIMFDLDYAKWELQLDIPDDLSDLMFEALLRANRIERCRTFLAQNTRWNRSRECARIVEDIIELKTAKYRRDVERASDLVDRLDAVCGLGWQREVRRAILWLITLEDVTLSVAEIEQLGVELDANGDAELQKYLADLFDKNGEHERADAIYRKICSSRNGMLRLELKDKGYEPADKTTEAR